MGGIGPDYQRGSPRIIHIPLSGGDRKAQAKGIRNAHGLHDSYYRNRS